MRTRFTLFAFFLLLLWSCAKEEEFPLNQPYPVLKTLNATPDSTGAEVTGELLSLGKNQITEYGFTYAVSSAASPINKKVAGTSAQKGTFKASLTRNLVKGLSYDVQAYAVANGTTVYGNKIVFNSTMSAKPVISGFSPTSGLDGTRITITGESFSVKKEEIKVTIGFAEGQVVKASLDSIEVIAPHVPNTGNVPITVTVRNQQKAIAKEQFTVLGPHTTHLSTSKGRPGDEITIYGTDLNHVLWGPDVYFGGQKGKTVSLTETEIKVIVPVGTPNTYDRRVDVSVSGLGKTAEFPSAFTIESGFQVASVMPTSLQVSSSGKMPSFMIGSKAYLFSYDRLISYHMGSGTWKDEGIFPGIPKNYITLEQVGNKVYLMGGRNSNKYYGDVWEYDYLENSWTQKKSLPFAVYSATSFTLNGKIYFFGGTNSSSSIKVWQYDPETETVQGVSSLPGYSNTSSTFFSGGDLYVILNSSLWAYHVQQDSWVRKGDAPGNYPAAYTYKDQGYVMSNSSLFRYNAAAGQWTKVASYPGCVDYSSFFGFSSTEKLYIASSLSCSRTLYSYQE